MALRSSLQIPSPFSMLTYLAPPRWTLSSVHRQGFKPQSLLRGGRLRKHVHPMTVTPKIFRADIRWRWRDGVTPVFPAQNDLVGQHRHIIVERRDLDALHGVIG